MDSLTAHFLARELDEAWRGHRIEGCAMVDDPRTVLISAGGRGVALDLTAGVARAADVVDAALMRGWTVRAVEAPTDERRLLVRCERPGKFRGSRARTALIEVSFVPRAQGAEARDAGGHVLARVGARLPPQVPPRPELAREEFVDVHARGDRDTLLAARWMSARLADWLLRLPPDKALAAYHEATTLAGPRPAICDGELVPFPWCADARAVPTLIAPPAEPALVEPRARSQRSRALSRLREELHRASDEPRIRAAADALIALGRGAAAPAEIELPDGTLLPLDAKPGESAAELAARLYRDARAKARALEHLPARIASLERAQTPPSTRSATPARSKKAARHRGDAGPLPYRRYRSSGGLEIWVGRGARANEELTFRHARPADVWLHARDVSGAHVVLRWTAAESPPARDLAEAAALAAWHSKSRGSTITPVDWTRRRFVRRARGTQAGTVVVERATTIFARPSAALERRLRDPPA